MYDQIKWSLDAKKALKRLRAKVTTGHNKEIVTARRRTKENSGEKYDFIVKHEDTLIQLIPMPVLKSTHALHTFYFLFLAAFFLDE